jgi:hypothetical protein
VAIALTLVLDTEKATERPGVLEGNDGLEPTIFCMASESRTGHCMMESNGLVAGMPERVKSHGGESVDEEHVAVGAAGDRFLDGPAEQALEKAMLPAADDDQVCVSMLGNVEQPFGHLTLLGDELGLDLAARERHASLLELSVRKLPRVWQPLDLRLGRRQGSPASTGTNMPVPGGPMALQALASEPVPAPLATSTR